MKATHLRANIFRVLDKVARTGKPAEVESKGRKFAIVPLNPSNKLANLAPHPDCIVGSLEDLIHIDWLKEWKA